MPWKNGNPPLYHVWRSMINRCYNPKTKQYKDYGGRGIIVCPEWRLNYYQWFTDMGPRPKRHSIERIDNNQGYNKDNCKWATKQEQQRNRRINVYVSVEGVRYLAITLAEKAGVKTDTIVERASRGLPYAQVISSEKLHNLNGFKLGASISAKNRREKTHCKNGHPFTPENTRLEGNEKYTWRVCRACHRERHR